MLLFYTATMYRVFFFSGYRLKLFYWKRSKLQGTLTFEPNEQGFAQFESYLAATRHEPASFLVDLIEEDYYPKRLAHSTGESRRALVKRALTQQFREAQYTCAQYQGREKKEKQDVFLLSALTNPSIMDPWLGRIRAAGIALTGIFSVAHLMPKLLPRLHVKRKYVLIITQEVGTAFRQSFFDDKKMVFSRVAKLPRGSRDTDTGLAFACLLTSEIEQTIHYLEMQRHVHVDALEVHCLVPSAFHGIIAGAFKRATEQANFFAHDVGSFLPHKNLNPDLADSLLAWYCGSLSAGEPHYQLKEDKVRFSEFQLTQRLTWAACALMVSATLTTLVFGYQASQANIEAKQLQLKSAALQTQYDHLYGAMLPELSMAEQVRDVVLLAERVKVRAKVSPQDFYIELSKIVALPEFSSVTVTAIEWQVGLGEESQFDDLVALKVAKNPDYDPLFEEEDPAGLDGNGPQVNIGIVSGKFNINSNSSYRGVVALANDFIAAIESHARVERVDVLALPVEHRYYKQFMDEVSQELDKSGGVAIDGSFKFRVIMRGPVNA